MPGWSLWLVPHAASPADPRISHAISVTMSNLFPDLTPLPTFAPHVTLTSNISPDPIRDSPQEWLDTVELDLPRDVHVCFASVQSEEKFFKKLFIRCEKDEGLLGLCVQMRAYAVEGGKRDVAQKWMDAEYDPHCSLMYSAATVTPQMLSLVPAALDGIALLEQQPVQASTGTAPAEEKDKRVTGWVGGRVWLVTTDGEIGEWKPVAERVL